MDVDIDEYVPSIPRTTNLRRQILPVDDAHPFDLESYISNYSGRTAVDRLNYIISTCPSIATQALHLAVQHIHQLSDPSLYSIVQSSYEVLPGVSDGTLPHASQIAPLDQKWAEEMNAKNQAERIKLDVELKTYSNNMIKESIRMAHRDLGDYYRSVGDTGTALKHYTKSREFCASSQQVIEMCLSVLELLIEQRNYSHILTYVFKAEAALDAVNAASAKDANRPSPSHPSPESKRSEEREKVQSKLDLAAALAHLGHGRYGKAANAFLKLGSAEKLGDWVGKVVAPGDIAIYGTLCALPTLSRSTLKSEIWSSTTFALYVEQEPYVRDLIEAFMTSNFKTALDILSRYSTRHYIDIHLAPHVHNLVNLIRDCAVVLYFKPFKSIKLERMSQAFGWTLDDVEQEVVALIQSGQIHGRVDSQNKILRAKKTDYRADLFARAIQAGDDMQNANRKLLLRMQLQQADLVVKAPKSSSGFDVFLPP